MGTNYYAETDICPTCERHDRLHIGKSSAGWRFHFHAHPEYGLNTWEDWRKLLYDSARIRDEYGDMVPVGELESLVEAKKSAPMCCTVCDDRRSPFGGTYHDPEGHPFASYEFS